jgi:hypothetical protein
LKSPLLLFEKLTCLALVLSIFLIWIFLRAIFPKKQIQLTLHAKSTKIIKHILLKIKFLRERDTTSTSIFTCKSNFFYLHPRKRIIFFKIKYKQIFLQTRRRRRRR